MDRSEWKTRIPNQTEVLILGGGITGISLAALLDSNGKSVLLVEKGDFASGTSQASGMMVWGGLLYLKNLEFGLVRRFCRARDRLIRKSGGEIETRSFTYLGLKSGGRNRLFMWLALQFYQMLSLWQRAPVRDFPLDRLCPTLDKRLFKNGWTYEEGFLGSSDSRFALEQLPAGEDKAMNYCEVLEIRKKPQGEGFIATIKNTLSGEEAEVHTRKIVNCGGVWAEEINRRHGVPTEHTHHLSKGVYLLLPAPQNREALIMDMGTHGDTLCWVPWGEVVMWGPTETSIESLDQAHADTADIDFLLAKLNDYSTKTWTREDIVNVRCGVRPLAKKPGQKVTHPLDLSRRGLVEKAPNQPWWTVFGGKLSGAADLATEIYHALFGEMPARIETRVPSRKIPHIDAFFGGRSLPDPAYCRDFECCRTLEDYLRRRTNLAQWIPHGGFGANFEYEADLMAIAGILLDDPAAAEPAVRHYQEKVTMEKRRWHE